MSFFKRSSALSIVALLMLGCKTTAPFAKTRVYNGAVTSAFPGVVAVQLRPRPELQADRTLFHIKGTGVYVAPNVIVTDAHVTEYVKADGYVQIGSGEKGDEKLFIIEPSDVHPMPGFAPSADGRDNDFARDLCYLIVRDPRYFASADAIIPLSQQGVAVGEELIPVGYGESAISSRVTGEPSHGTKRVGKYIVDHIGAGSYVDDNGIKIPSPTGVEGSHVIATRPVNKGQYDLSSGPGDSGGGVFRTNAGGALELVGLVLGQGDGGWDLRFLVSNFQDAEMGGFLSKVVPSFTPRGYDKDNNLLPARATASDHAAPAPSGAPMVDAKDGSDGSSGSDPRTKGSDRGVAGDSAAKGR